MNTDDPETIRRNAASGDRLAQARLGVWYLSGEGGAEKNYSEAMIWLKKAADQNESSALTNIAFMYSKGLGVEQNPRMALEYYQKGAELGNCYAQYYLAGRYIAGEGVEQSREEAIQLFVKSAEGGNAEAQHLLGRKYQIGEDVKQDYQQAVRWYQVAADQGHAEAQFRLAALYKRGHGVAKNLSEAFRWYNLAAENGNPEAQNELVVSCSKTANSGSAEGKYFTTSEAEAASYARQAMAAFGDPPYTIVRTQAPNSTFLGLTPAVVDRGITAWVIPNDRLPGLVPKIPRKE